MRLWRSNDESAPLLPSSSHHLLSDTQTTNFTSSFKMMVQFHKRILIFVFCFLGLSCITLAASVSPKLFQPRPALQPSNNTRVSPKLPIDFELVNQRTLIMVKPDGVARGFIGDIISRFERKGAKLVAIKFLKV